ncbi:hypothetical protein K1719_008697 [Acacia pycnantha]|nr:hypothetical protein K1719_008697 [Acacia pycnantha]
MLATVERKPSKYGRRSKKDEKGEPNFVLANVWKDECAAWPVGNLAVTCASALNPGFPNNSVVDPFLFTHKGNLLPRVRDK